MDFKKRIREYDGFLSGKGEYLNRAEWHGFVIGAGAGIAGGPGVLAGLYGLVTAGKKLSGHLKDVKKEFAYTVGGFSMVEVIQWLTSLL